ncbi:MAG: hypothetical protein KBC64_07635 [Simkaniaceae bacterium]|nr:hypothetical protein [Simkaniaceae bacterium]
MMTHLFPLFISVSFFIFPLFGGNFPPAVLWQEAFIKKVEEGPAPLWMMDQIDRDLKGMTSGQLEKTMLIEKEKGNCGLVLYKIRDSQVTAEVNDPHLKEGHRYRVMTTVFQQIAALGLLSDCDFIVCLEDAVDGHPELPGPIFAFAKDIDSANVILMPDFDTIGDNSKWLVEAGRGNREYPWNKKIEQAFWRGGMTGGIFTQETFLHFPRSKVIKESLKHPHLIDARFTAVTQCDFPSKVKKKFPKYFGKSLSIKEHIKYKYQLLIDGNSCAYTRAYWQLFANSVILKQESKNIQWYYGALQPYVHYIPVKGDMSDVASKVRWALSHDAEVRKIAHNANRFASENLRLSDIYYYIYLLLNEYAESSAAF